jgi:hypothetical protein
MANGKWYKQLGADMKHSFSDAIACRFFSGHLPLATGYQLSALIFL